MDQIARSSKDMGQALRNARKAQQMTQADLATRSGIWQRTISTIETNAGGAKLDTIFDLLAALDMEIVVVPRSKSAPEDLQDIF
ncbi:helix-turn-helix domain-containing protein [Falsirhodobacter sp. alg1]|uniref:helix-turn-helix domain-containing protein n=1 Tax=Falsirhodobacter sp. alg1 TaxID=1472418 RepID=UPI0005ED97A9|nr:helix-turn-helix domain-containing protein [Falsirhodobacter sp. alg1]